MDALAGRAEVLLAAAGLIALALAALRPSWRLWLAGYLLLVAATVAAFLPETGGG